MLYLWLQYINQYIITHCGDSRGMTRRIQMRPSQDGMLPTQNLLGLAIDCYIFSIPSSGLAFVPSNSDIDIPLPGVWYSQPITSALYFGIARTH